MAKYGDKRDYRKIDIYVDGKYVATTTWSKTLREAKARFFAGDKDIIGIPCVHIDAIQCSFRR
jgi:hypothetical protein